MTDTCNAVQKSRGFTAICHLPLPHEGPHQAILADKTTYEWLPEPW